MKTHNGYGFLDVPEDATDICITTSAGIKGNAVRYNIGAKMLHDELPPGQWSILGLAKDLGEQDWKGIVEHRYEYNNSRSKGILIAKDYVGGKALDTATASGLSLLKSLGLKDNVLILKQQ